MKKKQITTMTNTDKATYPPPLASWCKKKKTDWGRLSCIAA